MSSARKFKPEISKSVADKNLYPKFATDKLETYYYKIANHEDFFKKGERPLREMEKGVRNVLDEYDIVMWDTPEIELMKKNPHFHYRMSRFYESMTIIVSQNTASGKQVELRDPAKRREIFGIL